MTIGWSGENSNNLSIYSLITNLFWEQKIEDAISNVVFKNANNNILFLTLGNDTLRKFAFKFFKNSFWKTGPNKDKFDIKTRALMPLIEVRPYLR
jgi:CBS domain-containing protein